MIRILLSLLVLVSSAMAEESRCKQYTPTVTAELYAAGESVGEELVFDKLLDDTRGGFVTNITIYDKAAQDVDYLFVFYREDPTDGTNTGGNNGATYDPTDAQNLYHTCPVSITDYQVFNTNDNAILFKSNIGCSLRKTDIDSEGDVTARLITLGTPTYASTSDITVEVCVSLDR